MKHQKSFKFHIQEPSQIWKDIRHSFPVESQTNPQEFQYFIMSIFWWKIPFRSQRRKPTSKISFFSQGEKSQDSFVCGRLFFALLMGIIRISAFFLWLSGKWDGMKWICLQVCLEIWLRDKRICDRVFRLGGFKFAF